MKEMTDWFIKTASNFGVNVRVVHPAPNGGEAIYFDFPKELNVGKKNPYFMIWTGDGKDYKWHAEFGHWYFPKNTKERKQYPTTEYFENDMITLKKAIKDYASRIGT